MFKKINFNAPVTIIFALVCLSFFALQSVFGLDIGNPTFHLLTYIFHHGSFAHIFNNLTFILLLGPMVEEKYGSTRFLIMTLITAVVTGLINILLMGNIIIGASGIVFMLIILASFGISNRGIPVTFILIFLLFIGKEVAASFTPDQISHFGHIMGGLCGAVFGYIFRKKDNQEVEDKIIKTD
jgi:membrane associated rhomboid family serine protease